LVDPALQFASSHFVYATRSTNVASPLKTQNIEPVMKITVKIRNRPASVNDQKRDAVCMWHW